MIEGMVQNFKRAVGKASDQVSAIKNVTMVKPISLTASSQRSGLQDLRIEGIGSPKVSNVYVNKKNMKLHVSFGFKSVKVSGRCESQASTTTGNQMEPPKVLLEAIYWNASWSASLMPMIGREHFDMGRVYTTHTQQKVTASGLKDCAPAMHDKLKSALMERVQSSIDSRLVEIMELVMMQTEMPNEETPSNGELRGRGRRAPTEELKGITMTNNWTPMGKASPPKTSKVLKRTKRQTPCQQGEELDDYVDQLFRFGTRIVRAMEPITLPNATIELPDYNLKIFLYEGKGTRAYKFKRAKSAWVFCSNETISLGLTIEVEELRVAYKYRVISGTRLVFDGDLEAKLSPKVQAQFSQAVQEEDSEEPVQQRVDRLRVFRLGRVHVLIRGLGNLTQSLSMLINSYLNDNQEELQPTFRMVEGDAVRFVNRMLANVNVPLLSVV